MGRNFGLKSIAEPSNVREPGGEADRCDADRDTPSLTPVPALRKISLFPPMLWLCTWPDECRVRGLYVRKGLAPRLFCLLWLPPRLLPRFLPMLDRAGEFAAMVLTFERVGESVAMFFLPGEAVIRDGMGE